LLQVNKKFTEEYSGYISKKNYFVVSSQLNFSKFIVGLGSIKIEGKLIFGEKSNFFENVNENDFIIPTDFKFNFGDKNISVNPALYDLKNKCMVDKVISNSLLIMKNECKEFYMQKGDYIIEKRLNKFSSENFNFNDYRKFDKNIISNNGGNTSNDNDNKKNKIENFFAPLDLDILTTLNFPDKDFHEYEKSNGNINVDNFYFFHYGYLVKNLENTVFKFELKRM